QQWSSPLMIVSYCEIPRTGPACSYSQKVNKNAYIYACISNFMNILYYPGEKPGAASQPPTGKATHKELFGLGARFGGRVLLFGLSRNFWKSHDSLGRHQGGDNMGGPHNGEDHNKNPLQRPDDTTAFKPTGWHGPGSFAVVVNRATRQQ